MDNPKPKLYITMDKEGMFLWFSAFAPTRQGRGVFQNGLAASKTRLPISWYGGALKIGECKEIDIDDILCQASCVKN